MATSNAGKLAEFADAAQPVGVTILPLPGLAAMPEPVEDAATFLSNAELKAVAYSQQVPGMLVLCDDSGLEVAALGGRPGVRSARFAEDLAASGEGAEGEEGTPPFRPNTPAGKEHPPGAPFAERMGHPAVEGPTLTKDERNNRAVLSLLAPGMDRACRFVCALAVARDGEVLLRAEGSCEGQLLREPQGEGGFGYDPLFLVPSFGKTMAALSREAKWKISHRGNAFRALLAQLAVFEQE